MPAWCWNSGGGNANCGSANATFANNVLMTTSVATSQGYLISNGFQPTIPSNGTVGSGSNLTASCSVIGSPLCSDRLGVARPTGSVSWDAGAYLYQAVPAQLLPSITTQPASQTVIAGQSATFSVVATGSTPLNYQWQANGTAIPGANTPSYTAPALTLTNDGTVYTVVVSNSVGSSSSGNAILTVNASAGQLTGSTSPWDFGEVLVGSTSTLDVTFTNSGTSFVTISSVTPSSLSLSVSGAPLIVGPGQSAALSVTFTPSGAGTLTATFKYSAMRSIRRL